MFIDLEPIKKNIENVFSLPRNIDLDFLGSNVEQGDIFREKNNKMRDTMNATLKRLEHDRQLYQDHLNKTSAAASAENKSLEQGKEFKTERNNEKGSLLSNLDIIGLSTHKNINSIREAISDSAESTRSSVTVESKKLTALDELHELYNQRLSEYTLAYHLYLEAIQKDRSELQICLDRQDTKNPSEITECKKGFVDSEYTLLRTEELNKELTSIVDNIDELSMKIYGPSYKYSYNKNSQNNAVELSKTTLETDKEKIVRLQNNLKQLSAIKDNSDLQRLSTQHQVTAWVLAVITIGSLGVYFSSNKKKLTNIF